MFAHVTEPNQDLVTDSAQRVAVCLKSVLSLESGCFMLRPGTSVLYKLNTCHITIL